MLPKKIFFILCISISLKSFSNDGSFYASGNHLIPINENTVSLTKEILTIKRLNASQAIINVYYELYNPGAAKDILVGFEAASPSGDVDGHPRNGMHPYMSDFTVQMNGELLSYKVAIVSDSFYYKNGKFSEDKKSYLQEGFEQNYPDFFYVYHFNAKFRKGINIIRHSYVLDLSTSVYETFSMAYVLTTAKRWANRKIDDFTLEIDFGEFSDLTINNTFFHSYKEWTVIGLGKSDSSFNIDENVKTSRFYIQKGSLFFHKTNFNPVGNIYISSARTYLADFSKESDTSFFLLPFSYAEHLYIEGVKNKPTVLKILRNLPFARRGYIFKSSDLQSFFEKQEWYLSNPNYLPSVNDLSGEEKEFLTQLEK